MSVIFNDDLIVSGWSAPTALAGRTASGGQGTWANHISYPTTVYIDPNGEARLDNSTTSLLTQVMIAGAVQSANDYRVKVRVKYISQYNSTGSEHVGPAARSNQASGSGNRAWVVGYWDTVSNVWRMNWRINGAALTVVDLGNAHAPTFTSDEHDLEMIVQGTNATLVVDGNVIGSASIATTGPTGPGYAGIYFNCSRPQGPTQGIHAVEFTVQSIPAATEYAVTGPSVAAVGVASDPIVITPNGTLTAVKFTPHTDGSGTFDPVDYTATGVAPVSFRYTPSSIGTGVHSITFTNDGGLPNPAAILIGVGGAFTVTYPKANQVCQCDDYSAKTGAVPIEGSFASAPAGLHDVEARLAGGEWQTFEEGSSGAFAGEIVGSGQGDLEIRLVDDHSTYIKIPLVSVGLNILGALEQSNPSGRMANLQNPANYNPTSFIPMLLGNDDVFKPLADPWDSMTNSVDHVSDDSGASGSYVTILAGYLTARLGMPVMVIPCAKGGTMLEDWAVPEVRDDATTLYGSAVRRFGLVRKVGLVLAHLGESNAANNTTREEFFELASVLCNAALEDFGVRPMWCKLQRIVAGDDNEVQVNLAIGDLHARGYALEGPDLSMIAASTTDNLHIISDPAGRYCASAWAEAIMTRVVFPEPRGRNMPNG
jgi:carbohydrate esterase-like sialic acid-specific acetylesterase